VQVSNWLAIASLLISLTSLAISLRGIFRDRYKLRCDGFLLWSTENLYQLGVTVTNDGRRPISITDVTFMEDEDRTVVGEGVTYGPIQIPIHGGMPDDVRPVELAESQTHLFLSKEMPPSEIKKLPTTIDICVRDSRGKIHHVAVHNDAR
jgi:hypothetical protein